MTRRIMETTCAAAVLMAIHMSAVSAGAASVDRPRADELTRQFNQKELEQLQSGAGSYSLPSSDIKPATAEPTRDDDLSDGNFSGRRTAAGGIALCAALNTPCPALMAGVKR